jgi:hypothetical protein
MITSVAVFISTRCPAQVGTYGIEVIRRPGHDVSVLRDYGKRHFLNGQKIVP